MASPTAVVVAVALLTMRVTSLMQSPVQDQQMQQQHGQQLQQQQNQQQQQQQTPTDDSEPLTDKDDQSEESSASSLSDWAWEAAQNPNHLLLRSEKRKLLFCMIPKNACTEFLSLMMRLDGFSDNHWNPAKSSQAQVMVHFDKDREQFFFQSSGRQELENILVDGDQNGWVRAVFLRDPAERLLSAYRSKVMTGYYKDAGYPATLTLAEFVERLNADGLDESTEPHLRPQSFLCGLKDTIDRYNYVGDFNSLEAGANKLITKVGGDGLAEEMLNGGWGPYGNQSLFGVPRGLREAGSQAMMPTTNASGASWLRDAKSFTGKKPDNEPDFERSLESTDFATSLESGIFWQNEGAEHMELTSLMEQLDNDPGLKGKVQNLYAMDYALINRARSLGILQ